MTEFAEEDLYEVVEVVCMTVLELPVQMASESDLECSEYLTCSISISGAWNGEVHVRAGINFLNHAAAAMFGMDPGDVEHMDRVDTFTELNNMMGGTVKCLLPEPSDLSLPHLIVADSLEDSPPNWCYFLCDDKPLAVAVTEAAGNAQKAA